MQTIQTGEYTFRSLLWAVCSYLQEFKGKPSVSEVNFKRWLKVCNIHPDQYGLYWQSDFERLKDMIHRQSQNQRLSDIEKYYRSLDHADE